ncbi:MAG: fibronectin type III domain-containing protein [Hominimerdicola sp.]
MNYSINQTSEMSFKRSMMRIIAVFMALVTVIMCSGNITAEAAGTSTVKFKLDAPVLKNEKTYSTEYTHPYNKQTNTIILHWNAVTNAQKYEIYIKGGQYSKWTNYATTASTDYTVTGLKRTTVYNFQVRAVKGNVRSSFSPMQTIKTARMNYDQKGWEAICRIVYHEVGQMSGSMWDKPIVYVSDCVVNRYVAAKYGNSPTWTPYYKRYNTIQDVIYKSGGFMSEAGLARDGATYNKVPTKVKQAVWGAVYGKTYYKGIANDYKIYYWCNRSTSKSSSKIAYSFKIPWGYFYIWRQYWG